MSKPDMAGKLKNLARELKDEKSSGVKKLGDKKREGQRKESVNDSKVSDRKN